MMFSFANLLFHKFISKQNSLDDAVGGAKIFQSERNHQRFVLQNGRVAWFWIIAAIFLLVPSMIVSLVLFATALIWIARANSLSPIWFIGTSIWRTNFILLLFVMTISSDFVISLVMLALAANSISRERRGNTWGLLLLTYVNARELILGKWLASLYSMRRDYWILGVLRIGFISLGFMFVYSYLATVPRIWLILGLLSAVGVGVLFTAVDAALTAMIALHGAVITQRVDNAPGGLGIALRIITWIVGVILAAGLVPVMFYGFGIWSFLMIPVGVVLVWALLLAIHTAMMLRTARKRLGL